ncbi:hypothetical protein HU742_014070 [Pseudomonas sp. SWRI102]|uniref:Uncharacterized protein n=1 Tax=Pseudomonas marvdashtae TaxID=2745500 RepID=A0A923FL58_9PSED|nr:hypothetical protein [Pseudomonas marvdashtae]MBV4552267.1 hypothetical protein [Pseudomonas marvdashtae]
MSDGYVIEPDKAILQLTNAVMALSRVLAQVAPELTQGNLAMAVEGSRANGHGIELVEEIYKTTFPNAKPTVTLSPEEFARKQRELGQ